ADLRPQVVDEHVQVQAEVLEVGYHRAVLQTGVAGGQIPTNTRLGDSLSTRTSTRPYLSLQSQLQRLNMSPPLVIDPRTVSADTDPEAFLYVRALKFWRPPYLPVLAVLLVLLIAGAAAFSVRTQPVNQLLLGVGSLVLGVWGIRAILVPGGPPYVTAVDLALSLVILLLLGGIIVRGLRQARQSRGGPEQG